MTTKQQISLQQPQHEFCSRTATQHVNTASVWCHFQCVFLKSRKEGISVSRVNPGNFSTEAKKCIKWSRCHTAKSWKQTDICWSRQKLPLLFLNAWMHSVSLHPSTLNLRKYNTSIVGVTYSKQNHRKGVNLKLMSLGLELLDTGKNRHCNTFFSCDIFWDT